MQLLIALTLYPFLVPIIYQMDKHKFETLAIRLQSTKTHNREHSVPLYLTSSFTFENAEQGASIFSGQEEGNLYSRFSNPNSEEFVHKLCALENCEAGISTSSGMAAIYTALISNLEQGDHMVCAKNLFGNALYIITQILPKCGISNTLVDVDNNEMWQQAIQKNTKLIYLETPSNPTLKLADLSFLGKLKTAHNLILIVDNCFATPYLQQPSNFGADIVIHSATKYIDGQGRVLGGAILGRSELIKKSYEFIRRTGACLSPFNAWILSKSLETLAIRMDRHCSNAEQITTFLKVNSKVSNVIYPHSKDFKQLELAQKQMKLGGGLIGFQIKGGLSSSLSFLNHLKIHSLTANLGDSRSIATHPSTTTHSKLSNEEKIRLGIAPGFIRLSVGLENIDDLIADIDQALNSCK